MKVLFFTNMYPNENDKVQGLFIKNQLENLIDSGIDVDYLNIKIDNAIIDYIKGYFALRKKLKHGKYDLIHAHYGFLGFLAAFQKMVPFVLTLHGSDVNIIWQRFFSKFAAIFASSLIVTNKSHKNIMGKKSIIIPTGIDKNTFYPIDRSLAREKMGLKKDGKYIVFPSWRTRKVKNYPLFSDVIKKLKEKDNTFEEILLEGLSGREVNLCFNASNLLLLTSFSEGSPLVIREALACNLPIVSLDVGDVAERIKNYSNCYIVGKSVDDIAANVFKIVSNGGKAVNTGNEGLVTLEDNTKELISIYNSVVFKSKK